MWARQNTYTGTIYSNMFKLLLTKQVVCVFHDIDTRYMF